MIKVALVGPGASCKMKKKRVVKVSLTDEALQSSLVFHWFEYCVCQCSSPLFSAGVSVLVEIVLQYRRGVV